MLKNRMKVIGVMSGTSLDGIDLVECDFWLENQWKFEIVQADTLTYPQKWIDRLRGLAQMDMDSLKQLDKAYTKFLSGQITEFIEEYQISGIDYVCSHGHTAKHLPAQGLTYQIGNLPELADDIGLSVICDFRTQDVRLGGQGAPLVPIGDALLFGAYDYCLNLGGFSNISFNEDGKRIAYDICPVNTVLNHYALKMGMPYDKNGNCAKKGQVDKDLLNELNSLSYYAEPWPKSLGVEWVYQTVIPIIDSYHLEIRDVLRTAVEHMTIQIGKIGYDNSSVLVTGGGAYNAFLKERLAAHSKSKIVIPEPDLVEYKEALIFGFLGVLRARGDINCLKSVTGASKDHSSGAIYHPKIAIT